MATSSGLVAYGTSGVASARPWRSLRELAVLGIAGAIYFGLRVIVEGDVATSTANAQSLLDLERSLGIDVETSVQQLALDHASVRSIGNLSYIWLHWPLLLAALAVLFVRNHDIYLRLRNAMFASGLVGLVLFAVLPMAPPRFMPGFVGTVSDDARRHYLSYPLSWTNQFAAFPSFHVGWTLIACLALAAASQHPSLKKLALVPALMVGVAVISTGNHYVIDSVVGALIAGGAYILVGHPGTPDELKLSEAERASSRQG